MNYLAHGYRFIDRPLYTAGTAVPDWLSVSDRRTRMRPRRIQECHAALTDDQQQIAAGIMQHLNDDDVFHRLPEFANLESELSGRFRLRMPDRFDHRPGFLGHVLTEMMLDAYLAENNSHLLRDYYAVLRMVQAEAVQDTVNLMARTSARRLAVFIERFIEMEFLYDYLDDAKLLARLNQVLRRVTLPPLDESFQSVLSEARRLLRIHGDSLLQGVASTPPD